MLHLHPARPILSVLARLSAIFLIAAAPASARPLLAAATVPAQARQNPRPRPPALPAVDHAPVANDDNLVAFTGQDFQRLYLLDNDTDIDGDPLTVYSITVPAHGDFFRNATTIDYTPFDGFAGVDTFKYAVQDPSGLKGFGTVTVTVVPSGGTGLANNRFAVYSCGDNVVSCDTSLWTVSPYSGASSVTGACNGGPGIGVQDADFYLFGRTQAFDTGLTLWIDGVQLTPRLPMTVTHYSLVSGPVSLGGVRVTLHYDGLLGSDTLRTQVIFANVSGSPRALTATLASNLGSNAHTTVIGSSSGDTAFTSADRWLVTSNSASNPEIVTTQALFGPNSPAVTPSAVYTSTFTCNEIPTPNNEGVRADFHLTVPAHTVHRLLFFTQLHENTSDALTDAAAFNAAPVGMLSGLSNSQLAQVVNWKLGPISQLLLPLLKK